MRGSPLTGNCGVKVRCIIRFLILWRALYLIAESVDVRKMKLKISVHSFFNMGTRYEKQVFFSLCCCSMEFFKWLNCIRDAYRRYAKCRKFTRIPAPLILLHIFNIWLICHIVGTDYKLMSYKKTDDSSKMHEQTWRQNYKKSRNALNF